MVMEIRYDILVENIKKLPLSEKEELKSLLEKYIIEEKRKEIYKNYQETLREYQTGKLKFFSDISQLQKEVK